MWYIVFRVPPNSHNWNQQKYLDICKENNRIKLVKINKVVKMVKKKNKTKKEKQ